MTWSNDTHEPVRLQGLTYLPGGVMVDSDQLWTIRGKKLCYENISQLLVLLLLSGSAVQAHGDLMASERDLSLAAVLAFHRCRDGPGPESPALI